MQKGKAEYHTCSWYNTHPKDVYCTMSYWIYSRVCLGMKDNLRPDFLSPIEYREIHGLAT